MRSTVLFFATTLGLGCATPAVDESEHVLARIERPTADGKDHYTFEFVEADGTLATLIGSPLGYPLYETRGCVLDTYLSVAADDAIVPIELRRACAAPGATLDPAAVRVDELRPIGAAFQPPARLASADAGPGCAEATYDARYDALLTAAKKVATKTIYSEVCAYIYVNEGGVCRIWTALPNGEKGSPTDTFCDPLTIPLGEDCASTRKEPTEVSNSACKHDVVGWGMYGPWLDWERVTPYGVSRLQAEVSTCTPNETAVFYWQSKRDESAAWSTTHYVVLGGPSYWMYQITAPLDHGDWGGMKYLVHANGFNVFPMMAGTMMKGISRDDCPTGLFL